MKHIRIQSIADIITNSSSEVFVIEAQDTSKEEIQHWIEDSIREMERNGEEVHYSGMGFDVTVYDKNFQLDPKESLDFSSGYQWLPEDCYVIDIDCGMYETLANKISNKFKILDVLEGNLAIDASTESIKGAWDGGFYKDPNMFKCPGGKWIGEKVLEFDKNQLEKTKERIEEIANKIPSIEGKTKYSFLKEVQEVMNTVDLIKSEMKNSENMIKYSEKMYKVEKERWERKNK